jgi:hypothetical protein
MLWAFRLSRVLQLITHVLLRPRFVCSFAPRIFRPALYARVTECARRDSLAIYAHLFDLQASWHIAEGVPLNSESSHKRQLCWDPKKKKARRLQKIFKLSAAAGSAYAHFFVHKRGFAIK